MSRLLLLNSCRGKPSRNQKEVADFDLQGGQESYRTNSIVPTTVI